MNKESIQLIVDNLMCRAQSRVIQRKPINGAKIAVLQSLGNTFVTESMITVRINGFDQWETTNGAEEVLIDGTNIVNGAEVDNVYLFAGSSWGVGRRHGMLSVASCGDVQWKTIEPQLNGVHVRFIYHLSYTPYLIYVDGLKMKSEEFQQKRNISILITSDRRSSSSRLVTC